MSVTSEKWLEKELRIRVKAKEGQCLKWVSPGSNGVPDRIVIMPNGKVYFVELKSSNIKELTGLQAYWQRVLTKLGHVSIMINDKQSLDEFMESI